MVRATALRAAGALGLGAVALAIGVVATPADGGLLIHIGVLAAVSGALLGLVLALRRVLHPTEPSPFEQALRATTRRAPERIQQLAQLEREVGLGIANAFDLHHRLRPTMRETAAGLLAARRGIHLDAEPGPAREALGADAWEIVRADRPTPTDRLVRGAEPESLDRAISALEAL